MTGAWHSRSISKSVVLLAWAWGCLWLLAYGRYMRFLRAEWWPVLAASLAMLTLLLLAGAARGASCGCAPKSRLAVVVQAGLLLLPLAYMAWGAPSSGLDSHAFTQRYVPRGLPASDTANGEDNRPPLETQPATVAQAPSSAPATGFGDPNEWALPGEPAAQAVPAAFNGNATLADDAQLLTVLEVMERVAKLDGQRVVTLGRVFQDERVPEGHLMLYRFLIVCCAADAIPIGVLITPPEGDELPRDTWVRVEGVVRAETLAGQDWAVITTERCTPIDPPANPYLSPF